MIVRSLPALVATCTPASGLHSSSSTTSSYWYFAFASALRSLTARSAEFRPPSPMAEFPPVSGPMNAMRTVSFARAGAASAIAASAATTLLMSDLLWAGEPSKPGGRLHGRGSRRLLRLERKERADVVGNPHRPHAREIEERPARARPREKSAVAEDARQPHAARL